MKICILGSTGLLGQALIKEARRRDFEVVGIARKNADVELDITDDNALELFFDENSFDLVINTVAIVNHKLCDEDLELAYSANARPSAVLSQNTNFKYVFISTDGYFSGDKNKKHSESAPVALLNEYARTKFSGECFALTNPNALVVRTNIIGFRNQEQPTFLEWAINALNEKAEMTLFDDYFTSSISTTQFSKALFDLLKNNATGVYNLASRDVFSKAEFIQKLAKTLDFSLENVKIGSVSSLSSKRADSLGLDVSKAEKTLGYNLPTLDEVLGQIKKEYENV